MPPSVSHVLQLEQVAERRSDVMNHDASSKNKDMDLLDQAAADAARKAVERACRDSKLVSGSKIEQMPCFDARSITLGNVLGRGGFCNVYDIHRIQDHPKLTVNKSPDSVDKYALKSLAPSRVKTSKHLVLGVADLATEACFLASISHPNIIKLHGVSSEDSGEFTSNGFFIGKFFLLLERIEETLEERIFNKWAGIESNLKGLTGVVLDFHGAKRRDLFMERLDCATQIASALSFLHKNNIMHRDIKISNIGFDKDGTVKLFDFGLARTLPRKGRLVGGTYKMTGCTGSLRYMAPEIARRQPYNELADVYSFAILFWEICSCQKAYAKLSISEMHEHTKYYKNVPTLESSWPVRVQWIMSCCWSIFIQERPSFSSVVANLTASMDELKKENQEVSSLKTCRPRACPS
mmetsp:Transcript_13167/g.23878  ORF Transcript_13167/g.23878 Transcript_13167/m.23878 type:complete len:408 (-) Transcript_13167:109-1332(-)